MSEDMVSEKGSAVRMPDVRDLEPGKVVRGRRAYWNEDTKKFIARMISAGFANAECVRKLGEIIGSEVSPGVVSSFFTAHRKQLERDGNMSEAQEGMGLAELFVHTYGQGESWENIQALRKARLRFLQRQNGRREEERRAKKVLEKSDVTSVEELIDSYIDELSRSLDGGYVDIPWTTATRVSMLTVPEGEIDGGDIDERMRDGVSIVIDRPPLREGKDARTNLIRSALEKLAVRMFEDIDNRESRLGEALYQKARENGGGFRIVVKGTAFNEGTFIDKVIVAEKEAAE